jgi:predicted RNA methylase/uncharacterized protein YbaR (Trm112 family)
MNTVPVPLDHFPRSVNVSSYAFPVGLLSLIRCPFDGGILELPKSCSGDSIQTAEVSCRECQAFYHIRDGILDLVKHAQEMDSRSLFEMAVRDRHAASEDRGEAGGQDDRLDVIETLRHVGHVKGKTVLELGCGTGIYTEAMASQGATIVACDFSMNSLRATARRLSPTGRVALVRADVGNFRLTHGEFDVALSTLYSNLPNKMLRQSSTDSVAKALKACGRYVLSAHHLDSRRFRAGVSAEGTYANGIYRCEFTRSALLAEVGGYFGNVKMSHVELWVPFLSRFRRLRPLVSGFFARIPVVRETSRIVLAICMKARD